MVVFTCNHCGESLQKPRVDKHYDMLCRKPKNLTCMDCLKDFDESYVEHVKCITEDERYAAKGSLPNGVVKKGEVAQESWTEMIQSIIQQETDLKVTHRNLMNGLSSHNNVPRKKHKFINFVKCSTGGKVRIEDVEAVWEIIESYKNKNKQENHSSENGENPKRKNEESMENEVSKKKKKRAEDQVAECEEPAEDKENGDKKKKKRKHADDSEVTSTDQVSNESMEAIEKKQKKKKTKVENNSFSNVENGEGKESIEEITSSGKKQNKKKNKHQENGNDVNETASQETADLHLNGAEKQKKKKSKVSENGDSDESKLNSQNKNEEANETKLKKKKNKNVDANESNIVDEETGETKKQKKKTNKSKENGDSLISNGVNNETGVPENSVAGVEHCKCDLGDGNYEKVFDFEEKILEVLETSNSISVNKLGKKIVKMHASVFGEKNVDKLLKKINRKLKKMKNVQVDNETVTLVN